MTFAWVSIDNDGALVDAREARVSIFDHGFTVADGVFETMKLVDGRVFAWDRHLARLRRSARILGIAVPPDEALTAAVLRVARANAETVGGFGRLRVTVTSGAGPLGSERLTAAPTLVVAAAPQPPWPATAQVAIASWPRNAEHPLIGCKTTSYAENVLALEHAHRTGASEALFFNHHGLLTEGTGSNVFIVEGDRVITPPLTDGLLAGVTRELVLECADTRLSIVEESVTRERLRDATEVFITSSTRDVQAVSAVDDRQYPRHDVTAGLAQRFATLAADPALWT